MSINTLFNAKVVLLTTLLVSTFLLAAEGDDRPANSPLNETLSPQQTRATGKVFMPGDAVGISAFPDTASFLNGIFPIDDRGYADLPVYGKVRISQMAEDEFERFLQDKYKDFLRFPTLQATPLIRVSVLGGVANPGLYHVDPDRSIWDVLRIAGGTSHENGLFEMRWKRDKKDVENNLIPMYQDGSSLKTIGFRSGDQIWVKTPGQPGLLERSRDFLGLLTAGASVVALIFTYQQLAQNSGR